MFGMRSCVPNSLRMLCCIAKVFFATSFHARFCWFVDKLFREFNILKRELCWIWRSESPGKRDRIFAKESCLCYAALTQEDRACCSSPRTLSPKDRLHAWQNRCSRCCRIYLPVSTSNKWEDNKKLFSERPQSIPNDSAVGRGDSKVGIACTRKLYLPERRVLNISCSAMLLQRSRKIGNQCLAWGAVQFKTLSRPPIWSNKSIRLKKETISKAHPLSCNLQHCFHCSQAAFS